MDWGCILPTQTPSPFSLPCLPPFSPPYVPWSPSPPYLPSSPPLHLQTTNPFYRPPHLWSGLLTPPTSSGGSLSESQGKTVLKRSRKENISPYKRQRPSRRTPSSVCKCRRVVSFRRHKWIMGRSWCSKHSRIALISLGWIFTMTCWDVRTALGRVGEWSIAGGLSFTRVILSIVALLIRIVARQST